eukprot:CAMPEP_0204590108 /NCGR_PEP_ID=MMETSP0661-20131031/49601_1 /ASSEMBLY_ACC=CAM_ASM_000606 /TAXON_ID=109239 /ORGANISM="Alexandrium margalefi, Strain AMGDE01CS-322" /LENGTH=412 /DNA_ID=CAMNT_0051600115 /DNA_START=30 /DNA_END=1268 /DNA_ORIENTATION=-
MSMALVSGALNCIFPDRLALINLNMYCQLLLPARCVYQAAAVEVWPSERVKALRVYESFYTVGYCLSSLWGAAVYSLGGWRLCMWCQTAVLSAALVLACTVRVLRPYAGGKVSSGSPPAAAALGSELPAVDMATEAAGPAAADREAAASPKKPGTGRRGGSWYLALFICLGPAVTIFAYASEWSIYLVYLTDKFDLGVLPIGIGQTAGDIGGALILMFSMLSNRRLACTTTSRVAACDSCLCSLPWSLVWLSALYVLSYISFLSDIVGFAIAGQVTMGTMYVLMQQGFTELVEWCSRRDTLHDAGAQQDSYQGYAAMADACFSFGCCLGSFLPFVILDKLSAEWVCYIAAGLVAVYGVAFVAVFSLVNGAKHTYKAKANPAQTTKKADGGNPEKDAVSPHGLGQTDIPDTGA